MTMTMTTPASTKTRRRRLVGGSTAHATSLPSTMTTRAKKMSTKATSHLRLFLLVQILLLINVVESFSPPMMLSTSSHKQQSKMKRHREVVVVQSTATTPETETKEGTTSSTTTTTTKELEVLAAEDEDEDDPLMVELEDVDTMEVKRRLLDLVPKMMGTADEFKQVEAYVNTLEQRYQSIQTLDFLNLALEGEWQLLFSTNLSNVRPKPYFRLRELCQNIQTDNLQGSIVNVATWDLANDYDQDEDGSTASQGAAAAAASTAVFDSSGTFSAKCSYSINQGARMVVDLDDHVLELAKGSSVPNDVENLVGLLHRSIPKELFDPAEHAIDTTYLDADLRIARMTGPRLEGVRDIFIRRNSMEINPGLS